MMTIDDKIKGAKIQFDINRKAAKILTLGDVKFVNKNILQAEKYHLLIKIEL